MKKSIFAPLLGLFILLSCGVTGDSTSSTSVIIGMDNRQLVENPVRRQEVGSLTLGGLHHCTAFAISPSSIMTAAHCYEDKDRSSYRFVNINGEYKITSASFKAGMDLAVLHLDEDAPNFPSYLYFGSKSSGDISIVSAISRRQLVESRIPDTESKLDELGFYHHTLDTIPGSSGSPLIQGGLVVAIQLGTLNGENIAISSDTYTGLAPKTDRSSRQSFLGSLHLERKCYVEKECWREPGGPTLCIVEEVPCPDDSDDSSGGGPSEGGGGGGIGFPGGGGHPGGGGSSGDAGSPSSDGGSDVNLPNDGSKEDAAKNAATMAIISRLLLNPGTGTNTNQFKTSPFSEDGAKLRSTQAKLDHARNGASGIQGNSLLNQAQNALNVADGYYANGQKAEGDFAYEVATGLLDLSLSLTPGVGWAKDLYELVTGKNLLTSEPLTGFERTMAAIGVLTAGIGSKLALAGKAAILVNIFKFGNKGGEVASDVTKIAEETEKIIVTAEKFLSDANKVGGKSLDEGSFLKRTVELADDTVESGSIRLKQGVGGARYEIKNGTKLRTAKTGEEGIDFVDLSSGEKISLKGPYRQNNMDPLPDHAYNPETFAKSVLKPNTAVDKIVVDLFGFSEAEKELIKSIIKNANPSKPIEFLE